MVRCDETRSQRRNLELALAELARRIAAKARRPRKRKKTRITAAAKRRRVEAKRKRSVQKALRGRVGDEG